MPLDFEAMDVISFLKSVAKKTNEKYVRLGTSLDKCFVLYNHAVLTNIKLLVFDCLFDDDKELSDPIDRSPVRSGSRF